jgi:hypothetical protein
MHVGREKRIPNPECKRQRKVLNSHPREQRWRE